MYNNIMSSLSSIAEFSVPLFHHIGLLFVSLAAVSQAVCRFPDPWTGLWFQSGVGDPILIQGDSISFKGTCIEAEGDKFLIQDGQEECVRCVVIHEKHYNVLQYKETYCDPPDNLINTCSRINGDAVLYTMFRINGTPEPCPFLGPFTFTYNRGHADCNNPLSTIDSCIEDYRLHFRYQACPDITGTERADEELVCLAVWKEGSTRYLVGKLNRSMETSFEEKYRCFIYEESEDETGFQVAQSGDATCIGLISSTEGSKTMKLTRTNPSFSLCEFPDWMTSYPIWHTLDRRRIYIFDLSSNVTFNVTEPDAVTPEMQVTCVETKSRHDRKVLLVLHSTVGCQTGYMCAVFYRRREHVIEFQRGAMVTLFEEACNKENFDMETAEFHTLLTNSPVPKQCPHLGKYNVLGMNRYHTQLPSPRENCKSSTEIHVGCNRFDLIEFHSDCPMQQEPTTYQCHGSWNENDTYYLITSRRGTKAKFCFIYVESENVVKFSGVSETCNRRTLPGVTGFITFNISNSGKCSERNEIISGPTLSSGLSVIVALFWGAVWTTFDSEVVYSLLFAN